MPAAWGAHVTRWSRINRLKRRMVDDAPAPSRNDEYLVYQTLVGSWPLALKDAIEPGPELELYTERLTAYVVKALREAKEHSSWTQPNADYEEAATSFVRRILDARRPNLFLADFLPFQRRIADLAMVTGLAQTVLKLTIPGVPDIYQGTELWDLSLVDPDNRRAVDYGTRQRGLAANESIDDLRATWPDGRIKQRVIGTLLRHRRAHRALYADGAYEPVTPVGARAEHILAFRRRSNGSALLVLVPVLFGRLIDGRLIDGMSQPTGAAIWQNTSIRVDPNRRWRDLFTGDIIEAEVQGADGALRVADALARLPIACLEATG
jgi:(1->4)-alpha-D-glucan 1-alpha-D-glucosylmutase